MDILIAFILATYVPPTVVPGFLLDTGMGKCSMDQFYVNSDGLCHRNSDGSAIHVLQLPQKGS